jgi:hypothetical protein
VMACVSNAMRMRRCVVPADLAMAMRGAEMRNPALHDKHHRDGENNDPHHCVGYGNQPANAHHAMRLVNLKYPGKVFGVASQVNRVTVTILRSVVKKSQRARTFGDAARTKLVTAKLSA